MAEEKIIRVSAYTIYYNTINRSAASLIWQSIPIIFLLGIYSIVNVLMEFPSSCANYNLDKKD